MSLLTEEYLGWQQMSLFSVWRRTINIRHRFCFSISQKTTGRPPLPPFKQFFFSKYFQCSFVNSDDCIGKITSKSIRLPPVLIQTKCEVDQKRFYLVKNWEIQIILFMIMFTRSPERIFNPIRYSGNIPPSRRALPILWSIMVILWS